MLYQMKALDFVFEDERGSLVQLVNSGYDQVNVVTSKARVLRGNHYHKKSYEAFYVISGSVELTLSRNDEQEKLIFKKGDFFQIEPYVIHSMFYLEDTVLVGLYDRSVEMGNGEKDIFYI